MKPNPSLCNSILASVYYDDILKYLLFSILLCLEILQISHLLLILGFRIQGSVPVNPYKGRGVVGVGVLGLPQRGESGA